MFFYDMHIHTIESIGENSVQEMIEMAKRLGFAGIAIVRYYTPGMDLELKCDGDIDIVNAIMIKAKTPGEMNKIAKKIRDKVEILMVHGGDYDVNRAACENSMIDILCHPELGRKDSGLDYICAKAANENNVAIEINFREILESYGRNRVYILSALRKNILLCKKYDVKVVTTSAAVSKWGMRGGRELAAVSHLLGLELTDAVASVTTIPEEMVKMNRKKLKNEKWEGVEIEGE